MRCKMKKYIKIIKVDMRSVDASVIEAQLQERVDEIQNNFDIVGEIRPMPSPNTAHQHFIVTCTEKAGKSASVKNNESKMEKIAEMAEELAKKAEKVEKEAEKIHKEPMDFAEKVKV